MPATYEPIATTTLSSAAASISFTSVPATYTDLVLVFVGTATYDSDGVRIRFNNDTGSNYSWTNLRGNGSAAASGRASSQTSLAFLGQTGGGMSSTIPSLGIAHIFNYAGSTYKTALVEDNTDKNGSGDVSRFVGLYQSTTAINRVDLFEVSGNLPSGVTATIYGIKGSA